jgi:tetratricopeptide (TPR) repeat protein
MTVFRSSVRSLLVLPLALFIPLLGPVLAQAPTAAPKADSAYFKSDWAAALAGYTTLVVRDTANAIAWFRIGVSQQGLGRFREAIDAYLKAKRFGFQRLSVEMRLARTYARLGNRDLAFAHADSAAIAGGLLPTNFSDEADFTDLRGDARFVALVDRVTDARYPCHKSPQAHAFDFWIGQWDVAPWNQPLAPRGAAGFNDVHPILEQCIVFENWHGSSGGDGKSFNYYDTNLRKWRQIWMSDGGGALDYTGEFRDGAMRFDAWTLGPDGRRVLQKLTFTAFGPDTVRQTFEASQDSGKTWAVTFDGRYVRRRTP